MFLSTFFHFTFSSHVRSYVYRRISVTYGWQISRASWPYLDSVTICWIIRLISNWNSCHTSQGVIVHVISNWPRAPILKLFVRVIPELYSTQSNYYSLLVRCYWEKKEVIPSTINLTVQFALPWLFVATQTNTPLSDFWTRSVIRRNL